MNTTRDIVVKPVFFAIIILVISRILARVELIDSIRLGDWYMGAIVTAAGYFVAALLLGGLALRIRARSIAPGSRLFDHPDGRQVVSLLLLSAPLILVGNALKLLFRDWDSTVSAVVGLSLVGLLSASLWMGYRSFDELIGSKRPESQPGGDMDESDKG